MTAKLNRWFVATAGLFLLGYALLDVIVEVLGRDTSYISSAILGLFLVGHFLVPAAISSTAIEEKLWFLAEVMIAMGLVGTIWGFMLMFSEAFANLDTSSPEAIAAVLTDLAMGMGVALVTTLTGLICAFTTKAYLVFIVEGE